MTTLIIIYLVSTLVCKAFISYCYKKMPQEKESFYKMMDDTGVISGPAMINVICLTPVLNTGMILIWIVILIKQVFKKG